jgi:hypothetical protein
LVVAVLALGTMTLTGQEKNTREPSAQEKVAADLARIAELLKELDSDKFEKRHQAAEQLRKMGPPAVAPLRQLLAANPSLEVAARARNILRSLTKDNKARELRELLAKPVDLPDGIPANSTLQDTLDFLREKFSTQGMSLNFVLDAEAFSMIEVQKVEEQQVSLRPVSQVRLSSVLRLILRQIRGSMGTGAYLIRDDGVYITTTLHLRPRDWAGDMRKFAPIVDLEFEKEPLDDVLRQLADASGMNIVLDPRVAEKGEKLVTTTLHDVAVDTATRLVADMADLKVVAVDTVLYVTSRANARELEEEEEKRNTQAVPGLTAPPPPK